MQSTKFNFFNQVSITLESKKSCQKHLQNGLSRHAQKFDLTSGLDTTDKIGLNIINRPGVAGAVL